MPANGGGSRPWGAPTWGWWCFVGGGHARERWWVAPVGRSYMGVVVFCRSGPCPRTVGGRARGALLQGAGHARGVGFSVREHGHVEDDVSHAGSRLQALAHDRRCNRPDTGTCA